MTKKRFIKQLMGCGVSRNLAAKTADCRPHFMSYEEYYPQATLSVVAQIVGIRAAEAAKAMGRLERCVAAAGVKAGDLCSLSRFM